MYYDVTGVRGSAGAKDSLGLKDLGAIVQFAGTKPSHASRSAAYYSTTLLMARTVDQVKVFYNDFGQCMGYVAWALLTPDVERRILRTGRIELRDFEWNEGDSLWIVDFLVESDSLRPAMAYMRDELFASYDTVTFGRQRHGKLVLKRASRDATSAFWSAASRSALAQVTR